METRKVQKVGGGTYTVSLPVEWAQEHGLEAGETAYLYTHRDGSLVVRWTEKEDSDLATTQVALADSDPATTRRILRAAYTAGFRRITLQTQDGVTAEQRRAIDSCTHRLTGFEIAEETDRHMTIHGLLDASDVSIRQSTLQLQYTTQSMLEDAIAFATGHTTESEHLTTRDDEADRIFLLVRRHFNRALQELAELDHLELTRPELYAYAVTARQLERIADHAVKITHCVVRTDQQLSGELSTDVTAFGADARQVIEDAATAVIDGESTELAHTALDQRDDVVQNARALDRQLLDTTPEQAYVGTNVLDSIIRTAEYGGNIAELALQTSLRS
jgi:phosphate uptake regulator